MDSNDVRREWAERSGEYSPEYYAYLGPNETSEWIRRTLDDVVGTDAAILELGCSSGRHLAHLANNGYTNLHGVDINDEAFDVMAETYPHLAADGTFYVDAIESLVGEFDDDQFDVVYSVETLQHVHPDDSDVFADVARIADTLVVTVENEGHDDGRAEVRRDAENESENEDGRPDAESVNYVDSGLPLYYRDWEDIFTEFGLVQVASTSDKRDTMRAFRPTE